MDRREACRLLVGLGMGVGTAAVRPVRAENVYTADEFRLLPLRVHLLRSRTLPDVDTRLTPADLQRILGKVNQIWQQAGIRFWTESILSEQAAGEELLKTLPTERIDPHLRLLRPAASRSEDVFHVYYVRRMTPNGIALGPLGGSHQMLFVKDTAELRPVQGGIDEPLPRVTAHEIGHALGLPHRQDTFNLMASGTTGTLLNEAESTIARKRAEGFRFHLKPAEALAHAEKLAEPQPAHSRALLEALAALPGGELAREARRRLGG